MVTHMTELLPFRDNKDLFFSSTPLADYGICLIPGDLTTDDFTHSLDHSIGLSGDLGQIFDNGTACDFWITFQTPSGNRKDDGTPEMTETTICAHKAILMLYPYFSASVEVNNITVMVKKPCQPYLISFIR